ncbi:hypothetical protein CYK57_00197 [Actinobacillus pleuropneumoniae]|uniref:Uncharacterized protein n=1 Tax=Actinobacillus pleuropneumoniae serovar 6 str. Femo TaxID=754256 RepID=A0A828PN28_ACTPL|nr:hypothetical protein appser2_870 [Actinobacillus pleuropneumoniae serovar 2 str. S1536]EFM90666.1 hypothetical protein appser4_1240 [Actinobacillus pleuropneumoniae serovar 4 str. M62]EFM92838.1 hypothetical protein appser6_1550 [Actinobacillus pleuropneumoniae serovar 6 str. Femo]EFM95014.1 hypothetical protein appser9_1260 [Actinobacillus pleuropneumoniae serovar 9 str. CVJ13261]EFM97208.1 hypothetical protein appser10_1360 [Actinobacillus pleuropneumoniae serovar 10 str. D13039]EFM99353.
MFVGIKDSCFALTSGRFYEKVCISKTKKRLAVAGKSLCLY